MIWHSYKLMANIGGRINGRNHGSLLVTDRKHKAMAQAVAQGIEEAGKESKTGRSICCICPLTPRRM